DLIFEGTGNSSVVFDSMQALGKNGVLVLSSVTGGDKMISIPADRINLEFVLGNKVMVGTVNANREYFELGVRDMAQAEAEYPGWLSKLLTDPVQGLEKYPELFKKLTAPNGAIIGLNTRRYHGLLVAAAKPPVGRFVLLSKLEETLFIEGQAFELSANRYPGVVHPQGFRYLKQFRLDPFPVFTYEVEGIEIEKSVFMIQGENSTVVHYELKKNNHPESPKNLWLELR